MSEVRVFISMPSGVRIRARLSPGLFDDGTLGAIVEVGDPASGEVALIARDAEVLDRLASSVVVARDQLLRTSADQPEQP